MVMGHALEQWFLTRGYLAMSEDIFGCHLVVTTVGRCYWTKDAAKYPLAYRTAPQNKTKNYLVLNVNSAKVEKRYSRERMPGFMF